MSIGKDVISIRDVVIRAAAGSAAALPMLMGGCVSTWEDAQSTRVSDNFVLYQPFDNERDWGPSYLVEAPSHHFGDEVRIDDTRSVSQVSGTGPTDPSNPPLTQGQAQTPLQPLP
jgi:hypothetical protein